ncbi:MAG: DUF4863 family protein [Ahrensia sp.]|nr:DUF4863 family protein [Ahrensia sp.]
MSIQEFESLMGEVAKSLEGRPVDDTMAEHLNATYPAGGDVFERLTALCAKGEVEGWLMSREHGGIKFGRAIKPGTEAGGFSVDVVRMKDVKGPHHIHTNGEIGAIMPVSGAPKFDGFEPGWYVYPPGSDHHPTVTDGDAYVLYLLPDGAIEFTGN